MWQRKVEAGKLLLQTDGIEVGLLETAAYRQVGGLEEIWKRFSNLILPLQALPFDLSFTECTGQFEFKLFS
jgi:hypothetical protein